MERHQAEEGMITRVIGRHVTVHTGDEELDCVVSGRLKHQIRVEGGLAVGDRVIVRRLHRAGHGVIEQILPRDRVLARVIEVEGRPVKQAIAANVDLALFVFSVCHPTPNFRMLDRFLVLAEMNELPAVIVANKIDLDPEGEYRKPFALYPSIGYKVIYTSAVTGEGLDALRDFLQGQMTVLAGPSGVGKSSLLNALDPSLDLPVGEVRRVDKGRHTTVVRQMFPLFGGWIIDTPGLRAIDPGETEEPLDQFFPEMRPYIGQCRFHDCWHIDEPDCAVRAAVDRGEITSQRYESYYRMVMGE